MRSLQPRMVISFLRISAAKRTLIAGMEPFLHKAKSSGCFSPLSFFAELHRASASDRKQWNTRKVYKQYSCSRTQFSVIVSTPFNKWETVYPLTKMASQTICSPTSAWSLVSPLLLLLIIRTKSDHHLHWGEYQNQWRFCFSREHFRQ